MQSKKHVLCAPLPTWLTVILRYLASTAFTTSPQFLNLFQALTHELQHLSTALDVQQLSRLELTALHCPRRFKYVICFILLCFSPLLYSQCCSALLFALRALLCATLLSTHVACCRVLESWDPLGPLPHPHRHLRHPPPHSDIRSAGSIYPLIITSN